MQEDLNQQWSVEKIDAKWVSDGLKDHFQKWTHFRAVLLDAPTGRGKNHFIMNVLIPHAIATGQQVFLFSNRIALSVQQKRGILETLRIPNIWTDEELRKKNNFGPLWQNAPNCTCGTITVLSYQSALQLLYQLQPNPSEPIGGFPIQGYPGCGYVVFDEAHFFLNDALFNAKTQIIFQRLLYAFSFYTRIYMTATPDTVLKKIADFEACNDQKGRITTYDISKALNHVAWRPSDNNRKLCVYKFAQDYSDYSVRFFSDIKQLYGEIKRTLTQKEKWLFFINNKNHQQEIARELRAEMSVKVDCFDSSKKNDSKLWGTLINGELPHDILLTTSALDNGINITDPALHHIVLECTDKVSFMQMLGRKRRKDGEAVNLYVYSPSESVITARYKEIDDILSVIDEYKTGSTTFIQRKWPDLHKKYRNLFWIDNFQRPNLNGFAEQEARHICSFYEDLLFQMQKAGTPADALNIYPKQVLLWMGLSQDVHWVNAHSLEDAKNKLLQLLEEHIPTGIPEDKHKEFFSEFAKLADIMYNGVQTVRKDVRSGPSIMNMHLKNLEAQLGCSYMIEGKGKWKVIKS